MCGFIHGFFWYFNLFTIYRSFNWIYIVSHYFESSAKLLKSNIFHTSLTSESCSYRATKECEVIRKYTEMLSADLFSRYLYIYTMIGNPFINCYSYICGYLIVFDKKKIRLDWWYMYISYKPIHTFADETGTVENCRKPGNIRNVSNRDQMSVRSIFTVDMMTSYKTVTCCARGDPCQMKFEFRTTLCDLCSSSRSLYTFLQWVNHCTAVTRVH